MPVPPQGGRRPATRAVPEAERARARRLRRWAVLAVLFPLFFFVVIAVGVAAMYYRRMEFFKPPPVGSLQPERTGHAGAPGPTSWTPAPPA